MMVEENGFERRVEMFLQWFHDPKNISLGNTNGWGAK